MEEEEDEAVEEELLEEEEEELEEEEGEEGGGECAAGEVGEPGGIFPLGPGPGSFANRCNTSFLRSARVAPSGNLMVTNPPPYWAGVKARHRLADNITNLKPSFSSSPLAVTTVRVRGRASVLREARGKPGPVRATDKADSE